MEQEEPKPISQEEVAEVTEVAEPSAKRQEMSQKQWEPEDKMDKIEISPGQWAKCCVPDPTISGTNINHIHHNGKFVMMDELEFKPEASQAESLEEEVKAEASQPPPAKENTEEEVLVSEATQPAFETETTPQAEATEVTEGNDEKEEETCISPVGEKEIHAVKKVIFPVTHEGTEELVVAHAVPLEFGEDGKVTFEMPSPVAWKKKEEEEDETIREAAQETAKEVISILSEKENVAEPVENSA